MALDKKQLLLRVAEQLSAHKKKARTEVESVMKLAERGLPEYRRDSRVDVGAVVDVWSTGEAGDEAHTLFLVPVAAEVEIPGSRRDERFAVVSPSSAAGRALLGRRAGETVQAPVRGDTRTWTVLEVS